MEKLSLAIATTPARTLDASFIPIQTREGPGILVIPSPNSPPLSPFNTGVGDTPDPLFSLELHFPANPVIGLGQPISQFGIWLPAHQFLNEGIVAAPSPHTFGGA